MLSSLSTLLIHQGQFLLPPVFHLASLAAVLVPPPAADQTGVNAAMIGLARIGAGFLAGVLTLFLVISGYQYMTTDEAQRGMHAKKAIGALLGGAVLVLVATTMAPQVVNAIVTGQ